jgi:hypothetical protein
MANLLLVVFEIALQLENECFRQTVKKVQSRVLQRFGLPTLVEVGTCVDTRVELLEAHVELYGLPFHLEAVVDVGVVVVGVALVLVLHRLLLDALVSSDSVTCTSEHILC